MFLMVTVYFPITRTSGEWTTIEERTILMHWNVQVYVQIVLWCCNILVIYFPSFYSLLSYIFESWTWRRKIYQVCSQSRLSSIIFEVRWNDFLVKLHVHVHGWHYKSFDINGHRHFEFHGIFCKAFSFCRNKASFLDLPNCFARILCTSPVRIILQPFGKKEWVDVVAHGPYNLRNFDYNRG